MASHNQLTGTVDDTDATVRVRDVHRSFDGVTDTLDGWT